MADPQEIPLRMILSRRDTRAQVYFGNLTLHPDVLLGAMKVTNAVSTTQESRAQSRK
jgi:hypothetical protein